MSIRLTLKDFLCRHQLTAMRVEQHARLQMGLPLGENTIYRMIGKAELTRIDLVTVNSLLESLSDLIGRPVKLDDIFEIRPGEKQVSCPRRAP